MKFVDNTSREVGQRRTSNSQSAGSKSMCANEKKGTMPLGCGTKVVHYIVLVDVKRLLSSRVASFLVSMLLRGGMFLPAL